MLMQEHRRPVENMTTASLLMNVLIYLRYFWQEEAYHLLKEEGVKILSGTL